MKIKSKLIMSMLMSFLHFSIETIGELEVENVMSSPKELNCMLRMEAQL